MATENVGGIQYTVDADTAAMIKAEVSIQKILNNMVKSFEKIDKTLTNTANQFQSKMGASTSAVKSTESTVSKSTKSIADDFTFTGKAVEASSVKFSQGMNKTSSSVTATQKVVKTEADKMVNEINDVGEAATKKLDTQVTKSAASVKKGIQSNLGQAGIQVQQFVGQLQGGQSAMVALAQQSADLGIVLGAPLIGVFVSLAAVLAGTLAPALFSSTSAIEKMEKAVENTKAVLTIGAYGVANYTEEIRNLATISQELVKIKLSTAMAEQQKVIQNVGEAAKQAYKDAIPLFNWSFDNSATSTLFGNLVNDKDLERLGSADPLITKARTGIERLVIAMRTIENGNTARGVEQLTDSLDFLSASAVQNTAAGANLVSQMTKIIEQYKVGKITIEQLKGALDESKGSFAGNAEALQEYLKGVELSTLSLKGNERELEKRRLALSGMSEQEQITALAAWDYMKKVEAQTKEQKEAKKADEERKESLKKVNDELDLFFDKESRRSTEKDAQQTATLTRQVQNIGLTPEEEIQAQYERELKLLQQAQEKEVEIRGTYSERIKQIEVEKNQRLKALREQEAKNSESFLATYGDALNSINGLFGSYVNSMDKDTKKSFEKWKKFATAQALVSTLLAVSNALATPAPWPVPLIMAGVAGAAGAMNVAQIRSQSFDGAREFGGPVTAGKSYLVGERGPEMFTPGTSGGITSNKDMNGGQPTVNIYNVPSSMGEPEVTMDKVNNAIEVRFRAEGSKLASGRGPIANGMKRGAGTQFNGAN